MFTLKEAYEALVDRTEFAVKQTKDTVCFDYIIVLSDSFLPEDNSEEAKRKAWIRRNMRGVTFCLHTQEILSLPLHKFYNLNQNPQSAFHLYQNQQATIYEKLDGSMIHFYLLKGDLVASTCRSIDTVQAKEALSIAQNNTKLKNEILESIQNGLTPIFEFVSPKNQIVVQYNQQRLVYLISRNRKTGKYIFEDKYSDKAKVFNIAFPYIFDFLNIKEFEGYVCHFENGEILKLKTPWYVERHRAVDFLIKPLYKLYEVALDGYMDDIIGLAADSYKHKLTLIHDEVQKDILNHKKEIQNNFDNLIISLGTQHQSLNDRLQDKAHRKKFVQCVKDSKQDISIMMCLYQGQEFDKILKKKLLENYTAQYKVKIWEDNNFK